MNDLMRETKSTLTVIEAVKQKVIEELGVMPSDENGAVESARDVARRVVRNELSKRMHDVPHARYTDIFTAICEDLFGLGCLEPLLRDDEVTDILVKGTKVLSISNGLRSEVERGFDSIQETKRMIDRMTGRVGKTVDASNPFCDCHLYDGSRCHIIIPPAADDYFITIRKLKRMTLTLDDWTSAGAIETTGVQILDAAIREKKNIIISGGTGAGKTTLLNTLANMIDENEIIITLEDTYELNIEKPNVRRLLTRQASSEGVGEIRFEKLLKNALRMNPDRLIMGEVRDEAAYDLLHALNIGHKGSISTIHSNSAIDAMWRLETLAILAAPNISLNALKRQISRVVDYIVQIQGIEVERNGFSKRRVREISSVSNNLDKAGDYQIQTLYVGAEYE